MVFELLDRHDFVVDPLPNLMFTRDSSVWISDRVAVDQPGRAGRRRESELLGVIYGYHPRFAGTKCLYGPELEQIEGGDVLLLAPSVIAVGVGERTTPAAAERLARRVFDAGLAHTVLAVPLDQHGTTAHLDTVCTLVDVDTVVMNPRLAFTLTAHTITPLADGMRVSRPQPFLEAAAQALGIDRLKVIETGLDPRAAAPQAAVGRREQRAGYRPRPGRLPGAERRDQRQAGGGRDSGDPGARQRAGQPPGRPPVHGLPGGQGSRCVTGRGGDGERAGRAGHHRPGRGRDAAALAGRPAAQAADAGWLVLPAAPPADHRATLKTPKATTAMIAMKKANDKIVEMMWKIASASMTTTNAAMRPRMSLPMTPGYGQSGAVTYPI